MADPRPSSNPVADPSRCAELEGYQLLGHVGRDGSAELVSAWATRGPLVGREVVIKRYAMHAHEPELSSLVLALAPLGWLRHRSVIAVHDIGSLRGLALVLEAPPSRALSSLVAELRLAVPMALRIGHDVASALDAARALVAPDGTPVPLAHGRLDVRSVRIGHDGVARVEGFEAQRIHAVKNASSVRGDPNDDVRPAAELVFELATGARPTTRVRHDLARALVDRGVSPGAAEALARAIATPGALDAGALAVALEAGPIAERFELAAAAITVGVSRPAPPLSAAPDRATLPPPAYRSSARSTPPGPPDARGVDQWLEQARAMLRRGS